MRKGTSRRAIERWDTLQFSGRVAAVLVTACLAAPASAAEISVRNDSEINGSTATPCNCFVPGERVAAWLTAPVSGDIVAVQALWKSVFGGAPDSLETSISILGAGTFPTPGAALTNQTGGAAVVQPVTLSDGAFNVFRFLDAGQTVPLRVPVSQGQSFVVALELFNQTSGTAPFGPDAAWDADGCQAGRNSAFVIPGGWSDACLLGVTGDWVLRAVIEVPDPPPPMAGIPTLPGPALAALAVLLILAAVRRQTA